MQFGRVSATITPSNLFWRYEIALPNAKAEFFLDDDDHREWVADWVQGRPSRNPPLAEFPDGEMRVVRFFYLPDWEMLTIGVWSQYSSHPVGGWQYHAVEMPVHAWLRFVNYAQDTLKETP